MMGVMPIPHRLAATHIKRMKKAEFRQRYLELAERLEHCTISDPDYEPLMLRLADICLPHQQWINTATEPVSPEPRPAWRTRRRTTRVYYHDRGMIRMAVWVPPEGRKAMLALGAVLRAQSV